MTGRPGDQGHSLLSPEVVAAFIELLAADKRGRKSAKPILTDTGRRYLMRQVRKAIPGVATGAVRKSEDDRAVVLPHWDAEERRLWLGDVLLKEFRQPAQNQTALLDAFQAHGWRRRHLADPLPRAAGVTDVESHRCLHDAIKYLNRTMPAGTIHFRGDGSAHGVWWEYSRKGKKAGPKGGKKSGR